MYDSLFMIFPSVLLSLSSVYLVRIYEIDLSLDQLCFFTGVVQALLFRIEFINNGYIIFCISWILLLMLLYLRSLFNRRFKTNSMIISLSIGMMLTGFCYLFFTIFKMSSQQPVYPKWIPEHTFWIFSSLVIFILFVLERNFSFIIRSTVPLSESIAFSPFNRLATLIPASLLIALSGTILSLHANSITLSFSSNIGILVASLSMISHGRFNRGFVMGLSVGFLYFIGIYFSTLDVSDIYKSYILPTFQLFVVLVYSLFSNRVKL